MQTDGQIRARFRTGKKAGIWLAFFFALGLHSIILLLPVAKQASMKEDLRAPIELQLTTFSQQTPILLPPETEPDFQAPEPEPGLTDKATEFLPDRQAMVQLEIDEPPTLNTNLIRRPEQRDLEKLSEPEREQLTNTVLSRQFFTEESAVDQLFGKPLPQHNTELRKEFHYPLRQDMFDLLDQPMPEAPFAYTPGLVYFAYDPGLKGEIQRFWDVITPEFGWRTKYGTEVRCIWALVIVGCGWK